MSALISIVDDDPEILKLLALVLGSAGYKTNAYSTPGRFFDGVIKSKPALCLIDVHLHGMDGREVIRVLRANPETKGIALIAMSGEAKSSADTVRGFEGGADEYLPKPLDLDLLTVRIENILRRSGATHAPAAEVLRWGAVEVTPDEHRVVSAGKPVILTHLEFCLLEAFLRQPNRVLARSWLLETVWKSASGVATRTVDKHVEALRKKVPPIAPRLETVVGVGYIFRP